MRVVLGALRLLAASKGLRWVTLLAFYALSALFEVAVRPSGAVPGVVSWAVFMAAGPALGGVLLEGGGAWLSVFFGALFAQALVHGTAPGLAAGPEMAMVQVDLLIAAGATLQAVLGAWLVRRHFGLPLQLTGSGSLVRLLILAGPLPGLLPLVVACCAAVVDHQRLGSDIVASGVAGWIIGSASVFIFLPLVLLHPWRAESMVRWRGAALPRFSPRALGYMLISLALTGLSWGATSEIIARNNRLQFQVLAEDGLTALSARIESYDFGLSAAAALLRASQKVSDADWRRFVSGLDIERHLPGAEAIAYVAPVARGELERYVDMARGASGADFTPHPLGTGSLYLIRHIAPASEWSGLEGLNLAADPELADAMRLARDSGRPQLSPRLTPPAAPDKDIGPGFVLVRPVYAAHTALETIDERRAAFLGWTAVTFTAPRLVGRLTSALGRDMDLTLAEGSSSESGGSGHPQIFYRSAPDTGAAALHAFGVSQAVPIYGRTWTVSWTSTTGFERGLHRFSPALVLIGGLAFNVLLGAFLLTTARREELIRHTVARKTREIALQEAETRSIIDTALVMIVLLDGEGVILRANDAVGRLFGIAQDRLPGTAFTELLQGETADYFTRSGSGEDATGFRGIVHLTSLMGEVLALDIQIRPWRTEGHERRYTVVMRNVAQRLHIEAQLRDTQHRLDVALKGAKIGVFDVDLASGTSIVSDTWRDLIGFTRDAQVDSQSEWRKRIHPDDRAAVEAADEACILGKSEESITEYRVRTVSGEWRWMRSHAVASERDETGRALRLVGVQMDITEARMLDQAKSEFVSTVSHELRTPLTSINGSLSLVLNTTEPGTIPERALRLLKIAQKNCDRLIPLVNDILDLEKVASGQIQFSFSEEDLGPLVRRSLADNKPYADQYNVRLRLIAAETGLVARIDTNRFLQVMANLLSNAAKFSEPGGTVELHLGRAPAAPGDETGRIRISVTDHGKGIPPSFHERIFRPFSQADSSATREKGGTGLGLNITKQIVERMGGEIGFTSTPGVETEFWVILPALEGSGQKAPPVPPGIPLPDAPPADADPGGPRPPGFAEAPAAAPVPPRASASASASATADKPVILHVEDDMDFAEIVAVSFGAQATLVHAERAFATEALADQAYDLVLLESAEAAGADPLLIDSIVARQPGVPLIALTASDKGETDRRVLRSLIKSRARLDEIVALCLETARAARAARAGKAGATRAAAASTRRSRHAP